ncbi:MAG: DsbA family protein [Candidatus Levybacteria bacterium]|nr:DsbA family protein [Candidatus Levybacteria bacterium]
MNQEAKVLFGIGLATVILLIGGVFYLNSTNPQVTSFKAVDKKVLVAGKNTVGSTKSKVTIVEFSDFQCPACGAFYPDMKKILSEYDGKVQFVYRHFPLPMHKNAMKAAEAAEAAASEKKFWEMHDKLFETQSEWSEVDDPTALFVSYAKSLGLNEKKFKKALDEDTYLATIQRGIQDGTKAGVNSTPSIFVNGRKIEGAATIQDVGVKVREAIDRELK